MCPNKVRLPKTFNLPHLDTKTARNFLCPKEQMKNKISILVLVIKSHSKETIANNNFSTHFFTSSYSASGA